MSTAQDVIARVRDQLQDWGDVGAQRYSDALLLKYVTLATRAVAKLRPQATAIFGTHTCTAGPRQRVDIDGAFRVMRVHANTPAFGDSDHAVGDWIPNVERDVMDSFYASWPDSAALGDVSPTRFTAACFDAKDPLAFFLFPTPYEGDTVIVSYASIPATLALTTDTLDGMDQFTAPLTDFVCHLAEVSVGRDEAAQNAARYLTRFLAAFGMSTAILDEISTGQPAPPEATE